MKKGMNTFKLSVEWTFLIYASFLQVEFNFVIWPTWEEFLESVKDPHSTTNRI
jgi:hypothetical protein